MGPSRGALDVRAMSPKEIKGLKEVFCKTSPISQNFRRPRASRSGTFQVRLRQGEKADKDIASLLSYLQASTVDTEVKKCFKNIKRKAKSAVAQAFGNSSPFHATLLRISMSKFM